MTLRHKVEGRGVVTYRCARCQKPIEPPDEPVFLTIDGRLAAYHPQHGEPTNGR